jgi:hypothetical protein
MVLMLMSTSLRYSYWYGPLRRFMTTTLSIVRGKDLDRVEYVSSNGSREARLGGR